MNKLEAKAQELLTMALDHGLTCQVIERPYYIEINYQTAPREGQLYSFISYTETERASVETYERHSGKRTRVSMKALPDYLEWHSKQLKK